MFFLICLFLSLFFIECYHTDPRVKFLDEYARRSVRDNDSDIGHCKGYCISGFPFPENEECHIKIYHDYLQFEAANTCLRIPFYNLIAVRALSKEAFLQFEISCAPYITTNPEKNNLSYLIIVYADQHRKIYTASLYFPDDKDSQYIALRMTDFMRGIRKSVRWQSFFNADYLTHKDYSIAFFENSILIEDVEKNYDIPLDTLKRVVSLSEEDLFTLLQKDNTIKTDSIVFNSSNASQECHFANCVLLEYKYFGFKKQQIIIHFQKKQYVHWFISNVQEALRGHHVLDRPVMLLSKPAKSIQEYGSAAIFFRSLLISDREYFLDIPILNIQQVQAFTNQELLNEINSNPLDYNTIYTSIIVEIDAAQKEKDFPVYNNAVIRYVAEGLIKKEVLHFKNWWSCEKFITYLNDETIRGKYLKLEYIDLKE